MLLHTGSGPNLLMSIPRDSLVPIPGHGTTKINAAYAFGGAKLLVKTIEQNTGIRIDQYVEIGLGGVVDIVDAVGGITICPTFDMRDRLAGLNIKKGCQEADGVTALGYARSAHRSALRRHHAEPSTSARSSAVGKKVLAVDLPQPVPLLGRGARGAGVLRRRQGHERCARACGRWP